MTSGAWTALAVRCEAAIGPDVDIDLAMLDALGLGGKTGTFARLTVSVDAVLLLISETLPNKRVGIHNHPEVHLWEASIIEPEWSGLDGEGYYAGIAATASLALLAAYCRARAYT